MPKSRGEVPLLCLVLAAVHWGCDPADGDADADADADLELDAETDAGDADAEDAALEVVFERRPYRGGREPVEGALVAFDAPSGVRLEGETDASGRVRFEGFGWSGGEAAITAYSETASMVSWAGLTERYLAGALAEDGAFHVLAYGPAESRPLVEVTGTVLRVEDPAHWLTISSSVPGTALHQEVGPDWSLRLPSGEPFTLVAVEHSGAGWQGDRFSQTLHGWTSLESPGLTGDAALELDMAEALPTWSYEGSMSIPVWVVNPATYRPYVTVVALETDNALLVGAPTSMTRLPDERRVEFGLEGPELSSVETPVTVYSAGRSRVMTLGLPGPTPPTFPAPPIVTAPAGSAPARPGGTVAFDLSPVDAEDLTQQRVLWIAAAGEVEARHHIFVPQATRRLTIPEAPAGVDAAALYGSEAVLSVRTFSTEDWSRDFHVRFSDSLPVGFAAE